MVKSISVRGNTLSVEKAEHGNIYSINDIPFAVLKEHGIGSVDMSVIGQYPTEDIGIIFKLVFTHLQTENFS